MTIPEAISGLNNLSGFYFNAEKCAKYKNSLEFYFNVLPPINLLNQREIKFVESMVQKYKMDPENLAIKMLITAEMARVLKENPYFDADSIYRASFDEAISYSPYDKLHYHPMKETGR